MMKWALKTTIGTAIYVASRKYRGELEQSFFHYSLANMIKNVFATDWSKLGQPIPCECSKREKLFNGKDKIAAQYRMI